MMTVLAYVPFKKVRICYLNRCDVIEARREGVTPQDFLHNVNSKIEQIFRTQPSGSTPFLERIRHSLSQSGSIARYFLGDGQPNGGQTSIEQIKQLVADRRAPQDNPITFFSISENDEDVEWMKELEEVAPFVAEFDDYQSEAQEVLGDQGQAFPFTKGFYLVGSLVAAMNPEDLDAMDESVPFTSSTLNNLLGVDYSEREYQYYFNGFLQAQSQKRGTKLDRIKREQRWNIRDFQLAPVASHIPAVQDFKSRLAGAAKSKFSLFGSSSSGGSLAYGNPPPYNPSAPPYSAGSAYPSAPQYPAGSAYPSAPQYPADSAYPSAPSYPPSGAYPPASVKPKKKWGIF
jgi:hypothetical protein